MNHSPQIDSMCNGLYVINIIIIMLVIIGLYISLSRIRSSPGMCNAWLLILSFSASLFLYISHNARVCIFKPRSVHCTRDLIVNRITRIGKRVSQKKLVKRKLKGSLSKKRWECGAREWDSEWLECRPSNSLQDNYTITNNVRNNKAKVKAPPTVDQSIEQMTREREVWIRGWKDHIPSVGVMSRIFIYMRRIFCANDTFNPFAHLLRPMIDKVCWQCQLGMRGSE